MSQVRTGEGENMSQVRTVCGGERGAENVLQQTTAARDNVPRARSQEQRTMTTTKLSLRFRFCVRSRSQRRQQVHLRMREGLL